MKASGGLTAALAVAVVLLAVAGSPSAASTQGWLRQNMTAPPERQGAAIAYDPNAGTMLLVGGNGAGGALGDTWLERGGRWTAVTASPGQRTQAAVVSDPATKTVVLFGGGSNGSPLGDT